MATTTIRPESALAQALKGISFTCSGSLQIDPEWAKKQESLDFLAVPPSSPPVIMRWDADGKVGRIQFPLQGDDAAALDRLIRNGAPATFGHHGHDVLDESYRKATKLDSSQFSSNFHPHDHGILDAISQTLLPTVTGSKSAKLPLSQHWGLMAELYKLNIYSAPSGRFKAHVDTPRGPRQWGSLVLCLPVPHSSGHLRVAHQSEEITYDWGIANPSTIEWAAFYSDCEHEVFEVTEGHRVTLTYNLYVTEQLGHVLRTPPSADPTRYPLDAILYSVFRHLGYWIDIRPVLQSDNSKYEDDYGSTTSLVGIGRPDLKIDPRMRQVYPRTLSESIGDLWSHERLDINWLNKPSNPEAALVHLTYGNEAEMHWYYSSLAIIVDVPPFHERILSKTPLNSKTVKDTKEVPSTEPREKIDRSL